MPPHLTRHAADSLRSPLMLRLGCRHPSARWSSNSRMESEHLTELPTRAVAPDRGVDKNRGRDRAIAWFSSSWSPVSAAESFGRPTH